MIAYATQPDNVALDGGGRNSPFTSALLKHIATPGLEVGSLMRRVRSDVVAATREKQVPWDHSSLMGDVVLVPASLGSGAATPAPVATAPVAAPVPMAPAAVAQPPAAAPPAPVAAAPASGPAASPPAAKQRAPAPFVPAFTREMLKQEPAIGKLPTGASALIDDGTCPQGQVKLVVGGNVAKGEARQRSCIARPSTAAKSAHWSLLAGRHARAYQGCADEANVHHPF